MSSTEPQSQQQDLSRLLQLYKALAELINVFFSGQLLIQNVQLNISYSRLYNAIEKIFQADYKGIKISEWLPLKNLISIAEPNDYNHEYGYSTFGLDVTP